MLNDEKCFMWLVKRSSILRVLAWDKGAFMACLKKKKIGVYEIFKDTRPPSIAICKPRIICQFVGPGECLIDPL